MQFPRFAGLLAFLPLLFGSTACHLFESDDDDTTTTPDEDPPEPALIYTSPKVRGLATLEIEPFRPELSNHTGDVEYRISPALPASLSFDRTTGETSGTTDAAFGPQDFTVRAVTVQTVNEPGGEPAQIDVDVAEASFCLEIGAAVAPESVTYPLDPALLFRQTTAPPNVPVVVGMATEFSIEPPLVEGLTIDSATGTISGSPAVESPETTHVVTAANPFGSVDGTVRIRVAAHANSSYVLVAHQDETFSYSRRMFRALSHRGHRRLHDAAGAFAATVDGRFLFSSTDTGDVVRFEFSEETRRPDRGTVVGNFGSIFSMLVDASGTRLVILGFETITSAVLLPDGSLGAQESLPVSDQAFRMDDSSATGHVYVLQSGLAVASAFRVIPTLAQVGTDAPLTGYPADIEISDGGDFAYVLSVTDSTVTVLRVESAVGAGDAPLTALDQTVIDGSPSDLELGGRHLFAGLRQGGGLLAYDIDMSTGSLQPNPSALGAGLSVDQLAVSAQADIYALDTAAEEIGVFDELFLNEEERMRTRNAPVTMFVLPGPMVFPRTQWVLATSPATDQVSVLELTYEDGALTPSEQSPFATGDEPTAVAMDHRDRKVYVTQRGSGSVRVFDFERATGTLSNPVDVPAGTAPAQLLVDPSGDFVYVLDLEGHAVLTFLVDDTDGSLSSASVVPLPLEGAVTGFELDPTGQFLYVFDAALGAVLSFRTNPVTGELTPLQHFALGGGPVDMAFSRTGRDAYFADPALDTVRMFDVLTDGTLIATPPTSVPSGSNPTALVVHPSMPELYALNSGSDDGTIFNLDLFTGDLTERTGFSPFLAYENPVAGVIDSVGTFLIVGNDDPATPALRTFSLVSDTGAGTTEFATFDSGDGVPGIFADSYLE